MIEWQELVERLRSTQTEILRVAPFRDLGLVPNPGASRQAIAAAEARLGVALPPSYRDFLLHHDGWPRCFDGASLLGTACLGNRLYDELARAAFQAAETPEPLWGLPSYRKQLPRLIPFGVDLQSTTLFAFDLEDRGPEGEYAVIAWINELGMRRDSFPDLLELLVELADYELAAHQALREPLRQTA